MENTWNKNITSEKLKELKKQIEAYISENRNSALVSRYFDETKTGFIYNTNAIEGNPVTEYDTAYIIKSNTFLEKYSAKDNMEVIGTAKAWDYIMTLPEISVNTIKTINKNILFFDVDHAGEYRKISVHVRDKQMYEPEDIAEAVERLVKISSEDVFECIAETHLMFENIHPFIDGNGRTGRMFLNLLLIKNGYLPINIKNNDSGKYYRCFRQYDKSRVKGIQEMFNLITGYEYEELEKLIGLIEQDKN